VGPRPDEADHDAYTEEVLPVAPSKWYLTGFLVPYEAPPEQRSDDRRLSGEAVKTGLGPTQEAHPVDRVGAEVSHSPC
tara:strand:- start:15964 stop:16197 length:234 start_codon:yes stop_codon:yes gene_type:complete